MTLIFTRRAYNNRTDRFTINPATLTRYIEIADPGVTVTKDHIIEEADWKAKVLAEAETPELLVYVHGFNTDQTEMLRRQRKIEAGLRTNGYRGAVIGYDWPSDGSKHSYDNDKKDAKTVAPYLVTEGIGMFLNETPRMKISVLAHSMGLYLTLRSFAGVSDAPGARKWEVDEMLAVAADADQAWMQSGAWGSLVMDHRAKRLTNYYSPADRVLKLSKFINGLRPRLGRAGLPGLVPARQFDVRCSEQYFDKVDQADRDMLYSHNWYFDDAGFLEDVALTLAGTAADQMPTRQASATVGDPILFT